MSATRTAGIIFGINPWMILVLAVLSVASPSSPQLESSVPDEEEARRRKKKAQMQIPSYPEKVGGYWSELAASEGIKNSDSLWAEVQQGPAYLRRTYSNHKAFANTLAARFGVPVHYIYGWEWFIFLSYYVWPEDGYGKQPPMIPWDLLPAAFKGLSASTKLAVAGLFDAAT